MKFFELKMSGIDTGLGRVSIWSSLKCKVRERPQIVATSCGVRMISQARDQGKSPTAKAQPNLSSQGRGSVASFLECIRQSEPCSPPRAIRGTLSVVVADDLTDLRLQGATSRTIKP